jgi:hypothetical protein
MNAHSGEPMRRRVHLHVLVLSSLLLGCAARGTPVRLQGDPSELRALAGRWSGEYVSSETGRSGSIQLDVTASGDSAFGDVIMRTPVGNRIQAAHSIEEHRLHSPALEVLRIVFVGVDHGHVEGRLEPYVAPDCQCRVETTFIGRIRADSIVGTFTTRGAPAASQRGSWTVVRGGRP